MQCDVTRIIFISNKAEYLNKELSKLYKSGYIVILIYLSNAINKILDKILFRRYFNELDFEKFVIACDVFSVVIAFETSCKLWHQ